MRRSSCEASAWARGVSEGGCGSAGLSGSGPSARHDCGGASWRSLVMRRAARIPRTLRHEAPPPNPPGAELSDRKDDFAIPEVAELPNEALK